MHVWTVSAVIAGLLSTGPLAAQVNGSAGRGNYLGLTFTTPAGWASAIEQGRFVVAPTAPPAGASVVIVLYGREQLAGSFDGWLGAKMSADLGSTAKVLQNAPPTRAKSGSLDVLSAGRTVQFEQGTVLLQIYYGITDGKQAGLAMVATTAEAALRALMPAVQAVFESLRFAAATEDGSRPSAAPLASTSAGAKSGVSAADLTGRWEHTSSSYAEYVSNTGGYAGSSTSVDTQIRPLIDT